MAEEVRFFVPTNYEQLTIQKIKDSIAEDFKLREVCTCPICEDISIGDLISDHDNAFPNARAHEAFSYSNESVCFRAEEEESSRKEYIKDKKRAYAYLGAALTF